MGSGINVIYGIIGIILLTIILIIIEKKVTRKKEKTRNIYYSRKLKSINKSRTYEALEEINTLARNFFLEAFDIKKSIEYSEVKEITPDSKMHEFANLMEKMLYSKKVPTRDEITRLSKILENLIKNHHIFSKKEKEALKKKEEFEKKKSKVKKLLSKIYSSNYILFTKRRHHKKIERELIKGLKENQMQLKDKKPKKRKFIVKKALSRFHSKKNKHSKKIKKGKKEISKKNKKTRKNIFASLKNINIFSRRKKIHNNKKNKSSKKKIKSMKK